MSISDQTDETTHSFLFIKSDLRLVTDLQHCIKAQQSQAYTQKVKLSNLKMMAQTVAYVKLPTLKMLREEKSFNKIADRTAG